MRLFAAISAFSSTPSFSAMSCGVSPFGDLIGRLARSRRSRRSRRRRGFGLNCFRSRDAGHDQFLADRQAPVGQIVGAHDLFHRNAVAARQGGERVALGDLDAIPRRARGAHHRLLRLRRGLRAVIGVLGAEAPARCRRERGVGWARRIGWRRQAGARVLLVTAAGAVDRLRRQAPAAATRSRRNRRSRRRLAYRCW